MIFTCIIVHLLSFQWSERRRFEIAGLMSSVLRAHLHAYDPVFSMTLRYLIRLSFSSGQLAFTGYFYPEACVFVRVVDCLLLIFQLSPYVVQHT
jgi:hypothetical protein